MRNEAVYSLAVRNGLKAIGIRAVRLEETSEPGIADLLVWRDQTRFWFVELKVEEPVSDNQERWLMRQWNRGRNSFILKHDVKLGVNRLWPGSSGNHLVPETILWSNTGMDDRALTEMVRTMMLTTYGKKA
jgi:hypothetical protein